MASPTACWVPRRTLFFAFVAVGALAACSHEMHGTSDAAAPVAAAQATAAFAPSRDAKTFTDPRSVTDIFISHVHGDHVGGLVDAHGTLVFPNATIHLSAREWAFLKGMNAEAARNAAITRYEALVRAVTPRVATFAPGARILDGLVEAVEIKGHTPGHSGYLITSEQSSLLYVGDAVHHCVVSVQRPEWPNGFDWDAAAAAASRVELLTQSAKSRQRLYAVHFPFPGIGRSRNEAMVFSGYRSEPWDSSWGFPRIDLRFDVPPRKAC